MIKVGVIFGGESVEHEVSIISAIQAMNKMDTEKYEIIPIYIAKDNNWYTGSALKDIETYQDMDLLKRYSKNVVLYNKKGRFVLQTKGLFKRIVNDIDMLFPVVHGTNVEDGTLQGYLRSIGIPFTGSDVSASCVSQDKIIQKQIFLSEKLNITNFVWFYDNEYEENKEEIIKNIEKMTYPVIVKPATLGSSVGIKVCNNTDELNLAIEDAIIYDDKILVEEVVKNLKEVNISVLGNHENYNLSVIEEVTASHEMLTYEDKYIGSNKKMPSKGMASASRKIPADLTEKEEKQVKEMALKASRAVNTSGICRIDFLIDTKKQTVYINEINACPGSLSFYLWDKKGKDYPELIDDIINIGIKDYKKKVSKTHSFDTNILKGFTSGLKGVKGIKGIKGKLK